MSAETLRHHRPKTAEAQATAIINGALEEQKGSMSAADIRRAVQERAEGVRQETRSRIDRYCDEVLPALDGEMVTTLDPGIGGVYYHGGGGIRIATATVQIHTSIADTIARTKETVEHEQYHEEHNHGEPMKNTFTDGDSVVTIGGVEFDRTELVEGVTVTKTGNKFVSDDYRKFEAMVDRATSSAGITLGELEQAIDDKNLTTVDDRLYEHGKPGKEPVLKA